MSVRIEIRRDPRSLEYQRNPKAHPAWDNNDAHNSLDCFTLFNGDEVEFSCKVQTVANLEGLDPGVRFLDTVAPGPWELKTDVDRRSFWPRIHGICNAKTLAGDTVDENSVTPTNPARWLMHDWEKLKPNPEGSDTRVAWSAGCFVVKDADLVAFGATLDRLGLTPGTLIPGVLS